MLGGTFHGAMTIATETQRNTDVGDLGAKRTKRQEYDRDEDGPAELRHGREVSHDRGTKSTGTVERVVVGDQSEAERDAFEERARFSMLRKASKFLYR